MATCIMNLPYLPIHILFFLLFLPYAKPISFQIPRFDASATNIVYEGDALPAVGVIEHINKYSYVRRVGRATHAERIPLWNSRTGKVTNFTTHFSFVIQEQESTAYGSGIAFFLAPFEYQIPPNSAGGFLGLLNTTTSDFTRNQIVVVEFDRFVHPEWDPPYQQIDLANVLPEWVTIGFSAGTRDIGPGPGPGKGAKKILIKIAVPVAVSLFSLIAANIPRLYGRRCKRKPVTESASGGERLSSINEDSSERGAGSRTLSYSEIHRATNNFSEEVGEGGSSTVYRGNLLTDVDTAVAVKKISSRSRQGRREYMTEVKLGSPTCVATRVPDRTY